MSLWRFCPKYNLHSGYAGVVSSTGGPLVAKLGVVIPQRTGDTVVIPLHAQLLCAFANTLDVDVDADPPEALPNPAALTSWLDEHRLLNDDAHANGRDLDIALTLRSGLREAMALHNVRDDTSSVPALDAAARTLPLHVVFDGTRPRLAPMVSGALGGLARLLVAIAETQADGTWERLKLCGADDCLLAFYDKSKNRSRHWCSMGECGNRQKTRNYRIRQRTSQKNRDQMDDAERVP